MGVSRSVFRRRLLAGASVVSLALHAAPAMASCLSASTNTTITSGTACVTWTGGNLSVTNTGTLSGATTGVVAGGSNPGGTLTNSGSISSTNQGINNSGSIGTLTNSGSISGTNQGISNSGGSIGTLTNASGGSIGGHTGIANTGGSIANLTNSGTISGDYIGIYNTGSIGALTNASGGMISGGNSSTNVGIYNTGSIGALTNASGATISGGNTGIYNSASGSIGTLTNNGTISGPVAIFNIGTLGPITNSGLIAGNITNAATQALTINGGRGLSFGLLTGSGGAITSAGEGTITNTASNLVFGSGNLLLNDTINVGSNTVTNSGATLSIVNTIGVTGTYAQSAGALRVGSNGELSITGAASITGGTIGLASTGNYLVGTSQTLVSATASSTYSGATFGTLTGLAATGAASGNNYVATFDNDYVGGSLSSISNTGALSGAPVMVYVAQTGSLGSLANSGTISGTSGGIFNKGSIGTLTNSGTISGGNVGIFNRGSIGTLTNSDTISGSTGIANYGGGIGALTNSGSISGGSTGIYNSGSIGTLTNSGTISGGNVGIFNNVGSIGVLANSGTISGRTAINNTSTGMLGPITNSGLIAGNIVNAAARTLTINGGSGSTYGTLTGSGGAITSAGEGTITNTASNVAFSSGNLLLNDAINVGTNSVITSGATIAVANPVSITGAWQQTGGGLVAQASSAASYGYLSVSGNATVANASVVIQGAGLINGNSFTIVRSGATGSYTGDTASVIGTSGLAATVQAVGGGLVVTLAPGATYAAKGLAAGGVAAPLGAALDAINGGSTPTAVAFQNSVLVPLALLPASQQGSAMKQLAPVQSGFQVVDDGVVTVLGAVEQHQQTSMAYNPQTGKAAGSDTLDSTLWAQMLGGGSERDSNAAADGYRSSDFGLTAGADHLFTPDLLGGVALSWLRAWTRGTASSSGQSSTMDSYQLTFYGTYRMGRAFLDGQLGAGWNHFDQNRSIDFLNETASAGYDGQQVLASALAGYDIGVGGPGNMTVTPLAGLRWLRAHNDSYTETGAGAADLSVNGQSADDVTQELGFRTAWSFQTGIGTIQPEFKAEWLHDYTNGPIATSGVIGGQSFVVSTPRVSANGARIGVAATLAASDSLSFRAEYDGELRAGYQSHTGLIKAMWQF